MNIFVMVDLEGISGIVKKEQVSRGEPLYSKAREYLVADVNACVEGLIQGGAKEIIVRDAHSSGFNFIWDKLDPRAEYVQGGGVRPRMPGIEEMDGMVLFIGYTMDIETIPEKKSRIDGMVMYPMIWSMN